MQPMFSIHSTCGLPLCVSTITHHLTFSKDMADHDLRREAMKKHRSRGGEGVHANQEVGFQRLCERLLGQIKREADSVILMNYSVICPTVVWLVWQKLLVCKND